MSKSQTISSPHDTSTAGAPRFALPRASPGQPVLSAHTGQPITPARPADVPGGALRTSAVVPEHECLTAKELASWLRVNRKTVYEYAARNVIPCRRLGRRIVFSRAAIAAWMARSPVLGPADNRR